MKLTKSNIVLAKEKEIADFQQKFEEEHQISETAEKKLAEMEQAKAALSINYAELQKQLKAEKDKLESINRQHTLRASQSTQTYDVYADISDMTVVSTGSVGGSLKGETWTDITGCVFLSDKLVVCERMNEMIILWSSSFTLEDSVGLEGRRPWDIAAVSGTTAIFTLPDARQLQYVEVLPRLKLGDVIQLDKRCRGVEVVGEEIYISCHSVSDDDDGEVLVCDMAGNLRRRIGAPGDQTSSYMFKSLNYLTVSAVTGNIYVSDWYTDTVTCLSSDGSLIYKYSDPELRHPVGLYVDAADNVIVCGFHSYNLQMITASGKKHRTLLSQRDGIQRPWSVAYRHSDNTLVVGSISDKLLVCKLAH